MSIASGDGNRELETDWQHSEFITECLNWHNVYRQRHGAPPLTLCPQVCVVYVFLLYLLQVVSRCSFTYAETYN
ncbi:hypothetical protein L798_07806 [Zootermopsis nevadensis]|uniref:SCP domain-containing protein n=1 Tax=Zootermopsis nevadensis TaxID=136037 RepID=A0A067RDI2_ZOONE|nr:hypothetical protein L798_07806 [Zootermopsis nevadensis]